MKTMTVDEYIAAAQAQGFKDRKEIVVKCPMCGTFQTPAELIAAGAGATFEEVEPYFGFSCVGRWTGAPSPAAGKKTDAIGCNWTLGGLFQLHKLEVVTPDGEKCPRFEMATPEEARLHLAKVVA